MDTQAVSKNSSQVVDVYSKKLNGRAFMSGDSMSLQDVEAYERAKPFRSQFVDCPDLELQKWFKTMEEQSEVALFPCSFCTIQF